MKPLVILRWKGSKNKMRHNLLPILDSIDHDCYCEPFGGSAAILLNKKPAKLDVYNDTNGALVALFRTLRDPAQTARLIDILNKTPICRDERDKLLAIARQYLRDKTVNPELANALNLGDLKPETLIAYAVYYAQALSFGGNILDSYMASSFSMTQRQYVYRNRIEGIPAVNARMRDVIVENRDFSWIFGAYDNPATLFYCDPPYFLGHEAYNAGWNDDREAQLIDIISGCAASVVLSCYDTPRYKEALTPERGWERRNFRNVIGICKNTDKRRETIETVYIKRSARAAGNNPTTAPSLLQEATE